MKKYFLTAAAVFGLMSAVSAQDISFGAKAGINIANFSGDAVGNSSLIGFHIGGTAEIELSDEFSFQPELMYSAQGASFDFGDSKLTYLNIPLMAKYYVAEGFSLEAGPQVGFLLSAKNKDVDFKDEVKGIDFGINAGVGYKLDSGLNFGVRYNLGLSNINDTEDTDDFKTKNTVIQLSVGYMF